MKRILIIGGNGSGKTTLARALSSKLGLPLIHLDKLYWRDDWRHASDKELSAAIQTELEKDEWIIDGNMKRFLRQRLKYCDTVIYLDFPSVVCAWGALKRIIHSHNKSRPDMGGNCIEKLDRRSFDFIKSIFAFNRRNRGDFYKWIAEAGNAELIVLKNRRQVKRFLKNIGDV